jgi:hypothetical protein
LLVLWQNVGFVQHPAMGSHTWPGAQQPPKHCWLGEHSQRQVSGLKTSFLLQAGTHAPVLGQTLDPGAHAHRSVVGSQKPLQHSMLCLHTVPSLRQRPGAIAPARSAPTSAMTLPAPAPASTFSACRREVAAPSDFVKLSN